MRPRLLSVYEHGSFTTFRVRHLSRLVTGARQTAGRAVEPICELDFDLRPGEVNEIVLEIPPPRRVK